MAMVKLNKAIRAIKKHTVGHSDAQAKALAATENGPATDHPFVSISQRHELAELSWDETAYEQITEILTRRLSDKAKWRRVTKALIVLHHCVQENPRFEVFCRVNKDLLSGLESFEYTFEEGEDHGDEVRKEARRLSTLLSDSSRLARIRTNASSLKRRASAKSNSKSGRLRRRGAFYVRSGSSTSSAVTNEEQEAIGFDSFTPMTMSDRVRHAVSGTVEWSTAMESIQSIADQTTCPSDFMEIMEAILEVLVTDGQNRHWGTVVKALVLLRSCLANVSDDVASHFEDRPDILNLLATFKHIDDVAFSQHIQEALQSVHGHSPFELDEKESPPYLSSDLTPPLVERVFPELNEKSRLEATEVNPPAYTAVNPDPEGVDDSMLSDAGHNEKARFQSLFVALEAQAPMRNSRPLPTPPPPIDWSRLRTASVGALQDRAGRRPRNTTSGRAAYVKAVNARLSAVTEPGLEDLTLMDVDTSNRSLASVNPHPKGPRQAPWATQLKNPDTSSALGDVSSLPDDDPADSPRCASGAPPNSDANSDVSDALPADPTIVRLSQCLKPLDTRVASLGTTLLTASGVIVPSSRGGSRLSILPPPACVDTSSPLFPPPLSPSCAARCLTDRIELSGTRPFAQGGFSDVWRGTFQDDALGIEEVAIKVLRAVRMRSDDSASHRMQIRMCREVEIWHALHHKRIVPLRGYAIDSDGTPSLISPWFAHGDVLSYLKRHPFADRRALVRQVAEGLIYLHTKGVVHGDLKGGNVLVDNEGEAALCDFGLARLHDGCPSSLATTTAGVGTLRWCAPELLLDSGESKTMASDVWAFAGLALEILTGRVPFYNYTNDVQVTLAIMSGSIPARKDYDALPADNRFWEVLEACWTADPSQRPTMAKLAGAIFNDEMFSAS